jgi:hypothetical protein
MIISTLQQIVNTAIVATWHTEELLVLVLWVWVRS